MLWNALMLSVERQIPLDNLRSWITVGTPFVFYQAQFWRALRCHLRPVFYVAVVALPLLSIPNGWMPALGGVCATLSAQFGLVFYRVRSSAKRLECLEKTAISRFGSRWVGVRSKHDEAIALLKAALSLRMPTVLSSWEDGPRWLYRQPGATTVRGRIPGAAVRLRKPPRAAFKLSLSPFDLFRKEEVPEAGWHMHGRAWMTRNLAVWPVVLVFDLIRFGYNELIVRLLNRMTASTVRARVLGDDSPYFVAAHVSDVPSRDAGLSAAQLPSEIEKELVAHADDRAKRLMGDLRATYISQLVLMSSETVLLVPPHSTDKLTSALVHCLYFEVEACQQFIVGILKHLCGGDASRTQKGWLDQARAGARKVAEGS